MILNGDRGAQVLLLPQFCEQVCISLTQVRSVPVTISRRELSEIKTRAQTVKEVCVTHFNDTYF